MSPKVRNENSDNTGNSDDQAGSSEFSYSGRRMLLALKGRDLAWLAQETGVPTSTLSDYVRKGIGKAVNAVAIAGALGVSLDWLLANQGSDSEKPEQGDASVLVAELDLEVAAGHGRINIADLEPIARWRFPREWVRRNFGERPRLRLVRVRGDSQEPELRDGDHVMIDLNASKFGEGMHVVRLDETLLIKRVQQEGTKVRLKSANPAYKDIVIDLSSRDDDYEVIGRAGWAGKLL